VITSGGNRNPANAGRLAVVKGGGDGEDVLKVAEAGMVGGRDEFGGLSEVDRPSGWGEHGKGVAAGCDQCAAGAEQLLGRFGWAGGPGWAGPAEHDQADVPGDGG
jgi:hypothetical protein